MLAGKTIDKSTDKGQIIKTPFYVKECDEIEVLLFMIEFFEQKKNFCVCQQKK
jgi:hypothetical protein